MSELEALRQTIEILSIVRNTTKRIPLFMQDMEYDIMTDVITNNERIKKLNAVDDIISIINIIYKYKKELNLNNYNFIQIFRSGIGLLTISNSDSEINSDVFIKIDINNYKQELKYIQDQKNRDFKTNIFLYSYTILLMGLLLIYYKKS